MLADGDSAAATLPTEAKERSKGRLQLLPRYHIENYFLDEKVLADSFASIDEPTESWLRDPNQIRSRMRELAQPFISYAVALRVSQCVRLQVGNADIMPSECTGRELLDLLAAFEGCRTRESSRISAALDQKGLAAIVESEYLRVKGAFERDDEWKRILPGRPILNRFAKAASFDVGRLKRLYIRVPKDSASDPFAEIRDIFSYFAKYPG